MEKIKICELKSNDTISDLVPEMTEKEYLDLKTSVEESGLRHPIDINKDYTILDGRHRVRVYEALGYENIEVVVHDLSESEAIKFVVDTAVNRRNLTEAQRLNIVLNSEDVITEIVERSKMNQGKRNDLTSGSVEPKVQNTTNTNTEIGKLAGVSKSTVVRAKKVKKENPEGYKKVVKGDSSWSKEYDNLPSVKNNKPKPEKEAVPSEKDMKTEISKPVAKPKKMKEDLRDLINNQSENLSESDKKLMRAEHEAMNIVEKSLALHNQIEEIKDLELFIRFVKTLDKDNLIKVHNSLEKLINMEDFINE